MKSCTSCASPGATTRMYRTAAGLTGSRTLCADCWVVLRNGGKALQFTALEKRLHAEERERQLRELLDLSADLDDDDS